MSYFKDIYEGISTALVGMKITWEHLFTKKVTNQYPELYHPIKSGDMAINSRNRIFVDMDGCDGCNSCARACPVKCITVETCKVTPGDETAPDLHGGKKRRTWVTKYDIDFALCCFCSLCTEACPTEAIVMTQEFEYSSLDRDGMLYHFSRLTSEEAAEKVKMFDDNQAAKKREQEEKKKAEAEAKKIADAAASTAPAGDDEAAKLAEREAKKLEAEKKKAERMAAKQAEN